MGRASFDKWAEEYHLTPGGWVTGTNTFGRGEVPRPANAVETWKEEGYQKSGRSREEVSHRLIWFDPSIPEEKRERLRAQFQLPFSRDSKRVTS